MTYRESVDALMSKLDAYFHNEKVLHEVGPTLDKLQVAEAKQLQLVERVEELKMLLVDKAELIEKERQNKDKLIISTKELQQLVTSKAERIEELKVLLSDRSALVQEERQKKDELIQSIKELKRLVSDKTERIEEMKILLSDRTALVQEERQKKDELICSVKDLQKLLSDKSVLIGELKDEFAQKADKERQVHADLAKRVEELKALSTSKTDELRQLYAQSRAEIKEARDESRLYLRELHLAQEELEQCFRVRRNQRVMLEEQQRLYARAADLFARVIN